MDIFLFQLAIVFLPGLVWERVIAKYGLKRPPTQFEIGLRTFMFGLLVYVITYVLYWAAGYHFYVPEIRRDTAFILDERYVIELAVAIVVAVFCSVLWLYAFNYKVLGRLLRTIRATKKYGDEDLWDFLFNSRDPRVEYVYVRDYANGKVFSGWVLGFSETDKVRELLLRDVQVFNLEGRLLYESPLLYVGRPIDAVDLEFPVTS
jgi:Family of unknown function (DUF6338)